MKDLLKVLLIPSLERPLKVRRYSWIAALLALASLVGGLIAVATGHNVSEESLLLPASVMIASFQLTRRNVNLRQDVLHSAVSALLTAAGIVFMAVH